MEIVKVDTKYGTFECLKNDSIYTDHLLQGQYWDGEIIENILKPYILSSKTILDIGGHIGTHAVAYGIINPNACIHTFEPQPHLYNLIEINCKKNTNIVCHNVCVGQSCRDVTLMDYSVDGAAAYENLDEFQYARMNYGGRSIGTGSLKAKMITIDSLNLDSCEFIKMDIEGAEHLAILGALNTIKKYKPVIFFEKNNKTLSDDILHAAGILGGNIVDTETMLRELGYNVFQPVQDYFCMNYLALHGSYMAK